MVDVQPPDLETKMAILDKKAEQEGIALPEDVRIFIATKTKSNVRELEGALVKLMAYSSVTGTPINLAMAQQILKHIVQRSGAEGHHRCGHQGRRRPVLPAAQPAQAEDQFAADRLPPADRHVPGQGADPGLAAGDRPAVRRQASHHGSPLHSTRLSSCGTLTRI